MHSNSLVLTGRIAGVEPMRYTPAGLPALNLLLEHESVVSESGSPRQVKLTIKALAFGSLAERLTRQAVGSVWKFSGYIAHTRQGKGIVFYIQEFIHD